MKQLLTIPNLLTVLRLIGSIVLIFLPPLGAAFYAVYCICGLSDVLDGLIARLTKCESDLGARLDSIADLAFYTVVLARLMPSLVELLPPEIWYAVGIVLLIRIFAYTVSAVKFRKFASLHTIPNKLTGLALFFLPFFLSSSISLVYCVIVCLISLIAAVNELIIHCNS